MVFVGHADSFDEVRLRTQHGDRLFALDISKGHDSDTFRLRRTKSRFDRDCIDDESLPLPVANRITPGRSPQLVFRRVLPSIRVNVPDGRQHTPKDELWATPWGDSIGHWEGQTLVIDTIAVKSAFGPSESEGVTVVAFGDVEGEQTITMLSPQAHFIERIRMPDKDHLEDQMTVIDPTNLTASWHMNRTYQRVAHIHRMVYEDCEGEERNPIVNGHFTLAPPPGAAKSRQ